MRQVWLCRGRCVNRWLGRAPRTADEVRRLQFCCDAATQCGYCPFRRSNAGRSIQELARQQLLDGL